MGLFNKYGKNIFGMTGTLGNKDTQELLEDVYPIKISVLPTYKEKLFLELPGIVETNRGMWIATIVESVIVEAKRGRAILVICETINDVDSMKCALRGSHYPANKVYCYARNDNEEYLAVNRNIDVGEVILATNLAGRGTDFKTTREVENAGGLHVCLTFLASNERVEEQAFGRTSRQGKRGTGQLIVNRESVLRKLKYNYTAIEDIATIKNLRNAIEQTRLKNIKYIGLYKTLISDELFLQFNELYQRIREEKQSFQLKQLEELWGFWLHQLNLDEEEEVDRLAKISFQSYLQERKLNSHSVIKGEDSFYYSIIHQLKHLEIQRYQTKDIDTLKYKIIKHIIANPELYNNVTANINEFAHDYFKPSQWNNDLIIKVVARILQVNIVLIKSDQSFKYYKREGATATIYVGHEINGDYLSLIKDGYKAEKEANVEIDTAEIKQVSTDEDNSEIILKAINKLEEQEAKDKGEEKRRKAQAKYDKFAEEITEKYENNAIAKNPSYETLEGNLSLKLNAYDKAIAHYDRAIKLDAIYSFAAHYNKAHAIVKHHKNAREVQRSLLDAKEQLEGHIISQLEATQMVLITDSNVNTSSELNSQLTNKMNLFKLQLEHINNKLSVIESVESKNEEVREKVARGEIKANEASRFIIEIESSKNFNEFYKEEERPQEEIAELGRLGLEDLFTIKEVEIVPKKESGFMGGFLGFVFGIVQIAFGAVVAACGGMALGVAIIVGGVKDLCAVVTGKFDNITLENYFKSKIVNYSVSIISMGWDNFMSGIEAVKAGATAAASGLKNITLQALGRGTVQQGAKESLCKSAIEIAKQEVSRAVLRVGAQELINYVADNVADRMVQDFYSEISKNVHEKVSNVMKAAQTQRVLDQAILIDTILGRQKYTNEIMEEMVAILRPEEGELIKAAGSIIKAIAQTYGAAAIGASILVAEKANAVYNIINITSRFCNELCRKLAAIGDNLPNNVEIFELYMHFLTKEDSQAVYNKLIRFGILNNAGKVIVTDLTEISTKISALDLGINNQFKERIITFCIELQDLQGKDDQNIKDRIVFNAEQMITNRIMQLVKAEFLSPAIGTVMESGVNKLREASKLSNDLVRQEMKKHYHRVTLTVDEPSIINNLHAKAPLTDLADEPTTQHLEEDTSTAPAPTSVLDLLLKPEGAATTAAATAQSNVNIWYNDPRIKCHYPYEHYISMLASHNNTATATTDIISTKDYSATTKDVELLTTSRDIGVPTTSTVQVNLSLISNVEASASETAQATVISLPVIEAMLLKYGPKFARVLARNGIKFIPVVGLAATALDVYDIVKPAVHNIYNHWFATKPIEGRNEVVAFTDKVNNVPNEYSLFLGQNRHEVEDSVERWLSIIANTQPETTEQSVRIWEVNNDYIAPHTFKKKRDDNKKKTKTSQQENTSTSTSVMPNPDNNNEDKKNKPRSRNKCAKAESPVWKKLEPSQFKEYRSNGKHGKKRLYFRWDHDHNEIEVYNHHQEEIGSIHPVTGEMYKLGTRYPRLSVRPAVARRNLFRINRKMIHTAQAFASDHRHSSKYIYEIGLRPHRFMILVNMPKLVIKFDVKTHFRIIRQSSHCIGKIRKNDFAWERESLHNTIDNRRHFTPYCFFQSIHPTLDYVGLRFGTHTQRPATSRGDVRKHVLARTHHLEG